MKSLVTIESDDQVRTIIHDHLRAGGYQVRSFRHIDDFLSCDPNNSVDLILTGLLFENRQCWADLERLISEPAYHLVPVVVVSALRGSRFRTRAYRLRVRDYIEKPFDFNELSARLAAILGLREEEKQGLSGSLRTCPFIEIAQIAMESRKTGILHLWSGEENGTVNVEGGALVSAHFAGTKDNIALERMVELQDGYFEFHTADAGSVTATTPEGLDLQRVVMETAWLEDELSLRRHWLPHPDARLRPLPGDPEIPSQFQSEAAEKVLSLIKRQPGLTLSDILNLGEDTMLRRRLAVAMLLEHHVVKMDPPPGRHAVEELPLTQQI